jgi:hypothetical protein
MKEYEPTNFAWDICELMVRMFESSGDRDELINGLTADYTSFVQYIFEDVFEEQGLTKLPRSMLDTLKKDLWSYENSGGMDWLYKRMTSMLDDEEE